MPKNLGNKVSRVLADVGTSFETVVFDQLNPPLDSELNLLQTAQVEERLKAVQLTIPSGFINPKEIGGGLAGNVNSQDTIIFRSPLVVVNGWVLNIGGGTNQIQLGQSQNVWQALSGDPLQTAFITIPAPALGSREDVVFLEVWRELVTVNSNLTQFGNSQFAGLPLTNDLKDPDVARETTQRVQVKFRLRVEKDIDFIAHRNGLGDRTVFGQGAKISPAAGFQFIKSPTDPGLFIAGDGTQPSLDALGTVDGKTYAIPIARIARRNKQPFSVLNPNGAANSLTAGVSDRPDGAFYDLILSGDIEDLRHSALISRDFEQIGRKAFDLLIRNQLATNLANSAIVSGVRGTRLIQIDGIAVAAQTGINNVQPPNGVRRVFSDASSTQFTTSQFVVGATDTVIQLPVPPNQPVGTILGVLVPTVYNKVTANVINGSWSNLGTTQATFTPNSVMDIQNNTVLIQYNLVYPSGIGLSFPMENVFNVTDENNISVGFSRVSDLSERQFNLLPPVRVTNGLTDSARILSVGASKLATTRGGLVEIDYHINGQNSEKLLIPLVLYGQNVLAISRVFDIQQNGDSLSPLIDKLTTGFQITLINIVPPGSTIRISVLTAGTTLDFNGNLKEVSEIARTEELAPLETPNGLITTFHFPAVEQIIANSGFRTSVGTRVYMARINNRQTLLQSLTGFGTPILTATFVTPPPAGAVIALPIQRLFAPGTTNVLNLTYSYIPYQGLAQAYPVTQSIEGEVLWVAPEVFVTTAGTGGPSAQVPAAYQGHIGRLPINLQDDTGNFFGDSYQASPSGAVASMHFVLGKNFNFVIPTGTLGSGDFIRPGDTLRITDATLLLQTYYRHRRGRQVEKPVLTMKAPSLQTGVKHLNAIYGLVRGKGEFEGELLLFVITTTTQVSSSIEFNTAGNDNRTVGAADLFKILNVPLIK